MKLLLSLILLLSAKTYALLPATAALEPMMKAVVLLRIPGPDADGDIIDALCNGTLISADTVVTAAHCMAGSTLGQGAQLKLEVGEYPYKQKPDGTTFRTGYKTILAHQTLVTVRFVSGIGFNSPANRIPPESDFAFIHLNTAVPVPADFIFAPIWNRSIQGLQIVNPTLVSVNPLEYINSNDTKQFAPLTQIRFSNYTAQSQSSSRVAPGDSGAPLFGTINGATYLIGVTKGLASSAFSNYDVFAIWGERAP